MRPVDNVSKMSDWLSDMLCCAVALPKGISHWSLTTLKEKLVKIGAKVVRHSRYKILRPA